MSTAEKTHRFYQNGRVTTELAGSVTRSIFQHQGSLLAKCTAGAGVLRSIMMVNNSNTVMAECEKTGRTQFAYTPYGRRPAQHESNNPLAFNGELLDTPTGCYLLGNGYRLFSTTLKRFHSPDNFSPFEKGGLNAYAYCAGDPVNRIDPTGHFSRRVALRVATVTLAVASIGAGIAALVSKSKTAESLLGTAAVFLGSAAIVVAVQNRHRTAPLQQLQMSRRSSAVHAQTDPPPNYHSIYPDGPPPPPPYTPEDSPPPYNPSWEAPPSAHQARPEAIEMTQVVNDVRNPPAR